MSTPPPNLYDLSYRMRQVAADIMTHETQIEGVTASINLIANTIQNQNNYLKVLLVCKAILMIPSKIDDYINMLCTLYRPQGNLPPDMDKDVTPAWMIASAIIAITNDKDRNAYADIFNYVYGYTPYVFFATPS